MRLLRLFSGPQCSLCDVAKASIAQVKSMTNVPFQLDVVDIRAPGNEEFFSLYKYDIPVLTIDGHLFQKHRIDPEQLAYHLNALQANKG